MQCLGETKCNNLIQVFRALVFNRGWGIFKPIESGVNESMVY